MKRRSVLKLMVAAVTVFVSGVFAWRWRTSPDQAASREDSDFNNWLESVVDTVVPADEHPGAVEAGIAAQIENRLRRQTRKRELYEYGRNRLDRLGLERYGKVFSELDIERREETLISLSTEDGKQDGRRDRYFFYTVRSDVLRRYYASPAGQRAVGYRPPVNGYRF